MGRKIPLIIIGTICVIVMCISALSGAAGLAGGAGVVGVLLAGVQLASAAPIAETKKVWNEAAVPNTKHRKTETLLLWVIVFLMLGGMAWFALIMMT
jgi:hypothetical protein